MKILMVGDSNLCSHIFKSNESATRFLNNDVTLFKPSVITTYKDIMEDLEGPKDLVIIGHLLNQVSDLENRWKGGSLDKEKENEIQGTVVKMAEIINKAAEKHNKTKFAVIPPLLRTYPDWLFNSLSDIKRAYLASIASNIIILPEPKIDENDLVADGVHLKPMAQQRMRNYVLDFVKSFSSETIEVTIEEELRDNDTNRAERKRKRVDEEERDGDSGEDLSGEEVARALLREIKKLRCEIKDRKSECETNNDLINERIDVACTRINAGLIATARVKEEVDGLKNYSTRCMVVLRKVKMPVGFMLPREMPVRAKKVRELLTEQINKLPILKDEKVTTTSIFLFKVGGSTTVFQDLRLTFGSHEEALEAKFRILKARENKLGIWNECDVSNDAVKATRVRVVLLLAMARELRREGQDVKVNRYIESPNLVIKRDGKITKNLTFVDSILEFGEKLSPEDIAKARRVAGQSFKGQLEQVFLVIKEVGGNYTIPTPSGTYTAVHDTPGMSEGGVGRGRGRGRGGNRGGAGRGRGEMSANQGPAGDSENGTQPKTFSQVVNNGI